MENKPNMAMIGMAVMGSNFAQRFAEQGYNMAMFNRTDSVTQQRFDEIPNSAPYKSRLCPVMGNPNDPMDMKPLVDIVGETGTYFIMVKADDPKATLDKKTEEFKKKRPTEAMINALREYLKPGAIIVDCANSYWGDTTRRCESFDGTGIDFFGTGVSGGEEGARNGPAIMPGGTSKEVYDKRLKIPLEAVAAKAPQDEAPCVTWIGNRGAGQFVKMVHNGIEYADMALIAETYDIMRKSLRMSADEIGDVFAQWNEGRLKSYLIEITADILHHADPSGKGQLVDYILDRAMMKGTGTWTVADSLTLRDGVYPIPTIYAAVESRAISAMKPERVEMSKILSLPPKRFKGNKERMLSDLENALYVAKISSYTQGIGFMQAAAKQYDFGGLDIGEIARIWRNGCIIRAQFLGDITEAYKKDSSLPNLMAAPSFTKAVIENMPSLERVCAQATRSRVPILALDASKDFILQVPSEELPANLLQAQRDYFGAHTYERKNKKPGKHFHTAWSTKERKEIPTD